MSPTALLKTIKTGMKISEKISPRLTGSIAAELFLRPRRHERPVWERDLLKKATHQRKIHGLQFWQFGDSPRKVLLVHGWDGRGSQMGKFVEPLLEKGFSVYLFDGPAHGNSSGTKTNMRHFSDKMMLVEDELGPFEAVIGHSFGAGAIILSLAKGFEAKKAVLIAGPSDIEAIFHRYSDFFALSEKSKNEFFNAVKKETKIDVKNLHLCEIASKLVSDALIIHDPADRDVPYGDSLKIHESWVGSEMMTPHGVGHRKILKDHDVIQRAVEFIMK